MDQIRKILSIREKKKQEKEKFFCFFKNGSSLLEELIVSLGGRYKLPIPSFTAEELIKATKNFSEPVDLFWECGYMFKGNLKERAVLVKIFPNGGSLFSVSDRNGGVVDAMVRDTVITSQMSHLKNVLKFIGCCLEFKYPAVVYEYAGTRTLASVFHHPRDGEVMSWRSRLKIASDIANVIVHLQTDFPTPIVYRDLNPNKVIVNQQGVAKLFDFTSSIFLPPGELQVKKDDVIGRIGYLDPEYVISDYVITQKTDVYSYGVLMLVLFMGDTTTFKYTEREGECAHIVEYVSSYLKKDQLNQIVDPKLFEEDGGNAQRQQMLAFADLALRCTKFEAKDRPDMIDVARELHQIQKELRPC